MHRASAQEPSASPVAKLPDHHEFDASLALSFADPSRDGSGARPLTVHLDYPGAPAGQWMAYRVTLSTPQGQDIQRWSGVVRYQGAPQQLSLDWKGRADSRQALADGLYTARLEAVTAAPSDMLPGQDAAAQVEAWWHLAEAGQGVHEQRWRFALGAPAAQQLPAFRALQTSENQGSSRMKALAATPATGSWPYVVYYGTLHGQTNDSDGGGAIGACNASQPAQTGAYGPADAYPYAQARGLDFLANTDHNHYFDGSSGTNAAGSAQVARARYQAGIKTATDFSAAHPGFLALYGMEWGVINNGGHLNIFNSKELFAWEYNSRNELFGDRFIAKNDYASLYATMRAQGLVGQFNHPDVSGQFVINGEDMAYSADGDEVMVLAEVMNSSAFSSNTTETESSRSSYEDAYNKLLERGYHVAPASNQDNHCANWGASYTNRTGLLIPTGTPLTAESFVAALRERRVFATMDKQSQLVFSANGRLMGSRFDNAGSLSLSVGYANGSGRSVVKTEVFEGVPGRKGTVSLLTDKASFSLTPTKGAHFYYVRLTQDDGKLLWSAPVWVNQIDPGADTTPPTVLGSVTGSSGTVLLSADARDNVGVAKVEFWLDGVLRTSLGSPPFQIPVDSSLLANGMHSFVAKAFDAAGNSATSAGVSFTISNAQADGDELEPNSSIATANPVGKRTSIRGALGTVGDKDYFRVDLAPGQRLKVDLSSASAVDHDLYLLSSTGAGLARSEGPGSNESLSFTNGPSARTVYIKVQSYGGDASTEPYRLSISYP